MESVPKICEMVITVDMEVSKTVYSVAKASDLDVAVSVGAETMKFVMQEFASKIWNTI